MNWSKKIVTNLTKRTSKKTEEKNEKLKAQEANYQYKTGKETRKVIENRIK